LRKVPVLVELPETASVFTWQGFFLKTGKGTISLVRNFFIWIANLSLVRALVNMLKSSAKARTCL